MPKLHRLAILDDYQGQTLKLGPWDKLPGDLGIQVFRDTITDREALVARLEPFDAILMMRERTPFLTGPAVCGPMTEALGRIAWDTARLPLQRAA